MGRYVWHAYIVVLHAVVIGGAIGLLSLKRSGGGSAHVVYESERVSQEVLDSIPAGAPSWARTTMTHALRTGDGVVVEVSESTSGPSVVLVSPPWTDHVWRFFYADAAVGAEAMVSTHHRDWVSRHETLSDGREVTRVLYQDDDSDGVPDVRTAFDVPFDPESGGVRWSLSDRMWVVDAGDGG